MKFFFVLSGLGSVMLTSLFCYFTSLVSVARSYTEDEPNFRLGMNLNNNITRIYKLITLPAVL